MREVAAISYLSIYKHLASSSLSLENYVPIFFKEYFSLQTSKLSFSVSRLLSKRKQTKVANCLNIGVASLSFL